MFWDSGRPSSAYMLKICDGALAVEVLLLNPIALLLMLHRRNAGLLTRKIGGRQCSETILSRPVVQALVCVSTMVILMLKLFLKCRFRHPMY